MTQGEMLLRATVDAAIDASKKPCKNKRLLRMQYMVNDHIKKIVGLNDDTKKVAFDWPYQTAMKDMLMVLIEIEDKS